MSNEKNPGWTGWLDYIGDYSTQLHIEAIGIILG